MSASTPHPTAPPLSTLEHRTPIITLPNKNIIIRALRPTDAPSLSHHGSSPTVWANLRNRIPHPYTLADAHLWINYTNDPANWKKSGRFDPLSPANSNLKEWEAQGEGEGVVGDYAIVHVNPNHHTSNKSDESSLADAAGETVIGAIGLAWGSDIYFRTAELGYWLHESYWGKGIMTAVVAEFVPFAWRTWGVLYRINSGAYDWNVGSRRVLEKSGLVYEGRREGSFVKQGRVGSEVMFGMVRREEKAGSEREGEGR